MYTLATKPQSVFSVVAASLRLYKMSLAKIWYWQLLFFLPSAAISLSGNVIKLQENMTTFVVFSLCGLIAALVMTFGQCFLFSRINNLALDPNSPLPARVTARSVIRKTLPALAGLVFISMLFIIVFLLIASPLELLIQQQWIIYCISTVLAVFIIAIPQLFFIPLLIFNRLTVVKSIKKGFRLVWGNWLRTFVVLVLLIFITAVIILLFGFLNYFILSASNSASTLLNWVGVCEGFLLNILLAPFFYCAIIVQYYDLNTRKLAG